MQTEVLDSSQLERAAAFLKAGQLVAFPTETVYGLGACLFQPEAIASVFRVKGRPSDNPLIVHIHSLDQVVEIAHEIPSVFYELATRFWPGPLTCILKKRPSVPSIVSGGLSSVAVRMPSHPLALELLRLVGEPLVAPSANLSGRPSPTRLEHVLEDLSGRIAAVLDGGEAEWGIESTVINLLETPAVLLRPGCITMQELEKILGPLAHPSKEGPVMSPGMKYRHYAPRCPIVIMERVEEVLRLLNTSPKKRLVLSSFPLSHSDAPFYLLSAKTLYTLLRRSDEEGCQEIVVLCDPLIKQDAALMNRLLKAAGIPKPTF